MVDRSRSWVGASAREIARAVRRGDTSATAVVADHLDHIRVGDPVVRAFRLVREAEAVAEAEIVDDQPGLGSLPLAGVPIAVKENTALAGVPTWRGSVSARGPVADSDDEVVRRLRGAGAVVVGTTRMPELGIFGVTDDETAITRNPWRTDRSPGGSSGGAAAAVAAGLVPLAHGNDGFGSIRIPAACCGLVGIKPGRGVVPPMAGPTDWLGLSEHGILATTVADAAIAFAVLAGATPEPLVPPGRLRIAVSARSPLTGVFPDAGNRDALAAAARTVVGLGHDAIRADPAYPVSFGLKGMATWFAAAFVDADASGVDRTLLQARNRRHIAIGERVWRRGWVRGEEDRVGWRQRCLDWFTGGRFDVLVTPVLSAAPPAAADWSARSWTANMLACMRFAPYAAPWNLAGFPAMAVPVGARADGLPAAVQLVGPPGSEFVLLALAGQLEQAAPWRRHAPGWPRAATGSRVS
jgi:amidase